MAPHLQFFSFDLHNTGRAKQHLQAMVTCDAVQCLREDVAFDPALPYSPKAASCSS